MKKLKFFTILLLNILFVACSTPPLTAQPTLEPSTTPPPTATKQPTRTPTETLQPTPEIKEHGDTIINFSGEVDFTVIKKANIEVEDGLFIRRWTPLTLENGQTVALVTMSENPDLESLFFLFSSIGGASVDSQLTDDFIDSFYNKILKIFLEKAGTAPMEFVTGNTSENILLSYNPFLGILEGNLADRMITFAETGNPDVLPKFKGIPYPVVIAYRIEWPEQ